MASLSELNSPVMSQQYVTAVLTQLRSASEAPAHLGSDHHLCRADDCLSPRPSTAALELTHSVNSSERRLLVTSAMPNQLPVPFKKTYVVPLREAVREYILTHYTDTHPDAYRWDIGQWEKLRAEVVSITVHIDRVNALIRYDGHTAASVVLRATHVLKLSCAARFYSDKTAT